jgi:glycosyltransferase involved in cell wall biosynthesis
MKILLLIKNFDFGGAENHVLELANGLVRQGCEVWLVSGWGRQQLKLLPEVVYREVNFSLLHTFPLIFSLIRLIRSEGIEIVHAHQRKPVYVASMAASFTETPVVATVHGKIRYDLRTTFVRNQIAAVIAICRNSLKGLKNDPLLRNISEFIPNGVSFPEQAFQIPPHPLSFYYISRLDQRHIEIIQYLLQYVWPSVLVMSPDAKFCIIGDGRLKGKLQKFVHNIDNKHIADSICLIGYVEDLGEHYARANLVFGVGRVAIESIAYGIPVFSMKINRMGEIITRKNFDHFQFGNFVDIDGRKPDAAVIIGLIADFIKNQDFYKRESLYLQQSIRKESEIGMVIRKTIELYQDVLNNKFLKN